MVLSQDERRKSLKEVPKIDSQLGLTLGMIGLLGCPGFLDKEGRTVLKMSDEGSCEVVFFSSVFDTCSLFLGLCGHSWKYLYISHFCIHQVKCSTD